MDRLLQFNYTRIAWSQGYKCSYRKIDEDQVLIVSGVFGLGTLVFYVTMRLINQKEAKKYLRISKRPATHKLWCHRLVLKFLVLFQIAKASRICSTLERPVYTQSNLVIKKVFRKHRFYTKKSQIAF